MPEIFDKIEEYAAQISHLDSQKIYNGKEIESSIAKLKILDKERISCGISLQSMHAIHYDTNKGNLLFVGLPKAKKSVEMLAEDLQSDNTKCYLIDFELYRKSHYVYELAMYLLVNSDFPRNFNSLQTDPEYLKAIVSHYFEVINDGDKASEDLIAETITKIKWALLVTSFDMYLMFALCHLKYPNSGVDYKLFAECDLNFYNKHLEVMERNE